MTTVLEGVKARYEAVMSDDLTGPKPKALRRILRTDIPLLLAVAEAAVAWEAARRADVFAMRKVIAAIEPADVDRTDEADKAHIKTADALATSEAALCALVTPLLEDEE